MSVDIEKLQAVFDDLGIEYEISNFPVRDSIIIKTIGHAWTEFKFHKSGKFDLAGTYREESQDNEDDCPPAA